MCVYVCVQYVCVQYVCVCVCVPICVAMHLSVAIGFLVFFCRMAMGGHFFSDNLFAAIFMVYLALLYRKIAIYLVKKNR